MLKKLLREIKTHKLVYFLLTLILTFGFFFRIYNINNLLGFYFDQGRDALVIWDFWHLKHIPFIGPTTGIAGIFRGPFYYYLITPFYSLGKGNPVWPSVFLSATTVMASFILYCLGVKIQDRATGLIAAALSCFSFNIVMASRWLSNPTPMLLLSVLFIWTLILIVEEKVWAWIPAVFIATISLFHFGSAGEVFYFPALLVLFIRQVKIAKAPGVRIILISAFLFFLAVSPLIAFDLKNSGLISDNIKKFLINDKSFAFPTLKFIEEKMYFYYAVFTSKIFNGRYQLERLLFSTVLLFFVYHLRDLFKKNGVKILILLLSSVIFGLIFFQGNFGNIYDYYLTGYYLPFLLLFSVVLGYMWKYKVGMIFVTYFIYLFLTNNYNVLHFKLWDKSVNPGSIGFINQKQVIDWVYKNSGDRPFNVDVYVPPVISYSYDYLFTWLGEAKYFKKPDEQLQPTLYTLYESDPDHQERLDSWLVRQKNIGIVKKEFRSGGIIVQERLRIR
jgi:hypothetical protein